MRRVIAPIWFGLLVSLPLSAQTQETSETVLPAPEVGPVSKAEDALKMDKFVVETTDEEDDFDATGMGYLEAERRDPPFSNDLLYEDSRDDDVGGEIELEMNQIASPSPADLATGSDRVNLRGFPTPKLRNAFAQTGIPEVLDVQRRETIQGALTPVTGRAAPGGIQNFMTARPPGKAQTRWQFDASSEELWRARFETGGPVAKIGKTRLFDRVALGYERKEGPEPFAYRETTTVSAGLTVRHNRSHSTMWQVDYAAYEGNPSPGVPQYRETAKGLILGRYLPLADFHPYGPEAGVRRRTGSASVQYEGQPSGELTVRVSAQVLQRELDEDRFTRGDYLRDEQRFGGTREPQHIEQPLTAYAADADLTWRFHRGSADHKLLVSVETIQTDYSREQRGLDAAERAALPLSVRQFDPADPDYYRPALTADTYRRIITDRDEDTRYVGLAVSERAAIKNGRVVATVGLRYDSVALHVADNRVNATLPEIEDDTGEWTHHAGVNWIVAPNRLLVYANTSTAFEPSTRVDARTGQIQGNETTSGFEAGLRGFALDRRLSYTLHGFTFSNRNISRRNPLYNDPIADPTQTQPELVAAGEEQFRGATLDVRLRPSAAWQLTGKVGFTDAITVRSPDLPEEEGRTIARVPKWTGAVSLRRSWSEGRWKGWNLNSGLIAVGHYVENYADTRYALLEYPGYTVVSAGVGYQWKTGKANQSLNVTARNLLNEDLLAKVARPGAGREFSAGYQVRF